MRPPKDGYAAKNTIMDVITPERQAWVKPEQVAKPTNSGATQKPAATRRRMRSRGRSGQSDDHEQITKHENEWQDKATAAAVEGARKVALTFKGKQGIPGTTQLGSLSEAQWGMIITGAIFGWIRTRCEQAIAEDIDQEEAVRLTGLSPSPCDVAVVTSILKELAEKAGVDWAQPLKSWSKDVMTNFLMLAWQLITKAEAARDQGKILRPAEDWDKTGDAIDDVPFDR